MIFPPIKQCNHVACFEEWRFFLFFFRVGGRNAERCAEKSISGRWGSLKAWGWLSHLTDREQCHVPAEAPPLRPLLLLHTQRSFHPSLPPWFILGGSGAPPPTPTPTYTHSICSYQNHLYCQHQEMKCIRRMLVRNIIHSWHKWRFILKRTQIL